MQSAHLHRCFVFASILSRSICVCLHFTMNRIRKNNTLNLKEKCQLLDSYEHEDKKPAELSRDWKVSLATVYNIISANETIRADAAKRGFGTKKHIKPPMYDAVEKQLYKTFVAAKKKNPTLPIDGTWIKVQAQDIAKSMEIDSFKASNVWLDNFKSRYDLTSKRACGEASKVNQESIDVWIEENLEKLKQYNPNNIFNADESGLFYRLLPSQTIHFKNQACHGGEQNKDRITMLLCANWSGTEKLIPLVIGKSANPRCFPKKSSKVQQQLIV